LTGDLSLFKQGFQRTFVLNLGVSFFLYLAERTLSLSLSLSLSTFPHYLLDFHLFPSTNKQFNHFSGGIPWELIGSTFLLRVLDLSHNRLTRLAPGDPSVCPLQPERRADWVVFETPLSMPIFLLNDLICFFLHLF
jgi:hypothetical protein